MAKCLTRLLKRSGEQQVSSSHQAAKNRERRRAVGLRILAVASDGTAPLQRFLNMRLSGESQESICSECEDIVQRFLRMTPEAIGALAESNAGKQTEELQAALDMAVKSELHSWTTLQNVSKGVAPTVATLLKERKHLTSSVMQNAGLPQPTEGSRWAGYKWVSSWRRHWGMPKGRFAHQDMPTVGEMRAKAPAGSSFVNTRSPNGPGVGFLSGLPWPALKRDPSSAGRQKKGGGKRSHFGGRQIKVVSRTGTVFRPLFLQKSRSNCVVFSKDDSSPKASASWQWFNWSIAQMPAGKTALRLNMDETTLRLFYSAAEGVIASEPIALAGRRGRLAQKATRGQTRGALSLVALLCDDSSIQPRLPQYVIGNETVLPASLVAELHSTVGSCTRMCSCCGGRAHG